MISYDLDIGESAQRSELLIATVANSDTTGVTLIFDGTTTATTKHYKRVGSDSLSAGDRVLAAKISGTYLVLGKIN